MPVKFTYNRHSNKQYRDIKQTLTGYKAITIFEKINGNKKIGANKSHLFLVS